MSEPYSRKSSDEGPFEMPQAIPTAKRLNEKVSHDGDKCEKDPASESVLTEKPCGDIHSATTFLELHA